MLAIGAVRRMAAAWRLPSVAAVGSVAALAVAGANAGSRSAPAVAYGHEFAPAVAFDGTNYLVVWEDGRGAYDDIYAARVSPAGAILDPGGIAISTAEREQREPTVAFDGANYLVAWTDYRSGTNTDIYGARVSRAGTVLDPAGIAIQTATGHQGPPTLAFGGTNYLVAWDDGGRIYAARVSPAGAVLDPTGIAISMDPSALSSYPSVAFDGANYLVAWGSRGYDIAGARVSLAGAVLDPTGIAISTAVGFQFQKSAAVAFDGTNYAVAWERSTPSTNPDIYGTRVTPAGAVLDPTGIAISTAGYHQRAPAVGSDGSHSLVAWDDTRSGTGFDIYGARVSQAGTVLDAAGIGISTSDARGTTPALAFDGTNYLVAWEDLRPGGNRIYGARVSSAGAVLDPDGIPISAPPPPPPPPPPPSARCKVPRVIGLRLSAARKRIKARHCAVGRIRRARSKRVGRVIGQNPKPGAVKRFGFPVKLVIGRRR